MRKQNTRKLLSVVLAMMMLISSVSVCFTSFAAGSISNADRNNLFNALKADGVSTARCTVDGNSSTIYDQTGNVKTAMDAYVTAYNNYVYTNDAHEKSDRLSNQIAEKIKTALSNYSATDYANYNMANILNAFKTNISPSTSTTQTTAITTATATVTIVNVASITSYKTVAAIPEKLGTNVYQFSNTDATYDQTSGCSTKTYHYLRAARSAGATTGTSSFDKKLLTALQSAWDAVKAYDLGESATTRAALVTKTQDELNQIYNGTEDNGLYAAFTAAQAAYVPAIINHFFPNTEDFLNDVTFAKTIADFYPITQEITALANTDYSSYDGDQLVELYETLNTKIESYVAIQDAAVKAYLEETLKFDIAGAKAKYGEIKKAYQIYQLNQLKPEVAAAYDAYNAYTEEDVSNGVLLGEALVYAIGQISGYIETLTTQYDQENVAEVFGSDYVNTLRTLKTNLSALKEMAEIRVDFGNKYAEFLADVWTAIDFDAETDELLEGVKGYDTWYTNLKTFLAQVEAAYPEFYANIFSAEGERLDSLMKSRIDEKYVALKTRFETAVETAYELYQQAQDFYGYKVTILSIETFSELQQRIGIMKGCTDIMEFLDETGNGAAVNGEAKAKYNELCNLIFTDYENFVETGGFDKFETATMDDIVRKYEPDSDLAKDRDYTVDKEKVLTVIEKLKALLASDFVKTTLGLDLDALLGSGLKEKIDNAVFTDEFLNTIVQYVYPIVAKEFAKVWAGLKSPVPADNPVGDGKIDVTVNYYSLQNAMKSIKFYLFPYLLGEQVKDSYPEVGKKLMSVSTPDRPNLSETEGFVNNNPWEDSKILNEEGKLDLDWGINAAEDKKTAFVNAASAALVGLEPLLLALLSNQGINGDHDTEPSGNEPGHGQVATGSTKIKFGISLDVTIDKITLYLDVKGNAGYNNAIIPILEGLGLDSDKIPNGNTFNSTADVITKGLIEPISALLDQLAADPIDFLLNALPNLAYAINGQRIVPLLSELNTVINYHADAHHNGVWGFAAGNIDKAMESDKPISINIGEMINLADLGLNVSSVNGLLSMFKDSLPVDLPNIDGGKLATLGTLKKVDTKRGEATYAIENGKAYTIEANKADVFRFLVDYLLNVLSKEGNLDAIISLLNKDGETTELPEIVVTILNNIMENPDQALAAITELTQPQTYPFEDYTWYESAYTYSADDISATDIAYLKYANSWTQEKAEEIVNRADSVITSLLPLLGAETTLNATVQNAINGLFTNEVLTILVNILVSLKGYTATDTLTALFKELDLDLSVWYDAFSPLLSEGTDAAIGYNGVTGTADGDEFTWYLDGTAMVDGDRSTFIDILCRLLEGLSPILKIVLTGEDISALNGVINIEGYDTYPNSIGVLFEALGITPLTNSDYASLSAAAMLDKVLHQLSDWLDDLLSGNTVKKLLTLLPNVVYFLESNALSTTLHNLLLPVLVVLDVIRPIYDVDINGMLSNLLADSNVRLNLENLKLSELLAIADGFLGTELAGSAITTYVIPALCSGRKSYTSVSGKTAYKSTVTGADALTILLAGIIEALEYVTDSGKTNAELLLDYIGNDQLIDTYKKVVKIFTQEDSKVENINWSYMYNDGEVKLGDFEMPEYTDETIQNYLSYSNAWTEDLATYLDENLNDIVKEVLTIAGKDENALTTILNGLINDKLYTNDVVKTIADLIENLLANLNDDLLGAIDVLLETNLRAYKATNLPNVTDKDSFIAALKQITNPLNRLINFVFFGADYRFFNGTTKQDLITIGGGEGYNAALVPILEALGCTMEPASAFLKSDGAYDADKAVASVLKAVTDRLDELAADPINEILKLLPNVLYFINANGVKASLNNLLAPFDALVRAVTNKNEGSLLGEVKGVPLDDLTTANILTLVENVAGIELPEKVKTFLPLFYMGGAQYFESANGKPSFRMVYPQNSNARRDMLTVLASFLLEVVAYKDNFSLFKTVLSEDLYQVLSNMLNLRKANMRPIDWLYTEYAGTDKTFSGIETSKIFPSGYGKLYTQEKAAYIAEELDDFVDDMIQLIGVQDGEGNFITSLDDLLDKYVGNTIYTTANANVILGYVNKAVDKVNSLPAATYIKAALNAALGVDLNYYNNYKVTAFADGDKDAFTNAICEILKPLYRVLTWLLCDDDISFFVDSEGADQVTLLGAEGYRYGIAPILEALDCKDIPSQEEMNTLTDARAIVLAVLTPLFNRIDEIFENPLDEAFELLPNVAYFINSNALDTCFKNLLNAVYTLFDAVEPLTGEIDIYNVLGIRLDNLTMQSLLDLVIEKIADGTDEELESIIFDAVAEMTTGKVVSYDSMTGFDSYKMVYAGKESKADTVTIVERFALRWIVTGDNAAKLKKIIREKVKMNDDGYKYVDALIDIAVTYCNTEVGMDTTLHTLYYIFYGLQHGSEKTAGWLTSYNEKVRLVKDSLGSSRDTSLVTVARLLDELYKTFVDPEGSTGNVFSDDGLAPNGFLALIRQISNWIQTIFEKLRSLFQR